MKRCLALTLLLAGCAAQPAARRTIPWWEPGMARSRSRSRPRNISSGRETGFWSAGRNDFRYKKSAAGPLTNAASERCDFSLTGRVLVMSGCRLAGRYTRTP